MHRFEISVNFTCTYYFLVLDPDGLYRDYEDGSWQMPLDVQLSRLVVLADFAWAVEVAETAKILPRIIGVPDYHSPPILQRHGTSHYDDRCVLWHEHR